MKRKYKILSTDVVKSLINFLDEVQIDAASNGDTDSMHKVNFCNWAINELLNSFDGFITAINKDKIKSKPNKTKRNEIIDDHFLDWVLPDDMTDDEFEKLIQQFENFVKGWEKEYNKTTPKKKSKKKTKNFKPKFSDVVQHCSLDEIKDMLLDDPELTPEERFELYYEEHNRVKKEKSSFTLNQIMKKVGIKGYNDDKDKRQKGK